MKLTKNDIDIIMLYIVLSIKVFVNIPNSNKIQYYLIRWRTLYSYFQFRNVANFIMFNVEIIMVISELLYLTSKLLKLNETFQS